MPLLKLTQDQLNAVNGFTSFLLNPDQQFLVIEGYAGTGKTTLVKHLLESLPKLLKLTKVTTGQNMTNWDVVLSATTNKAAEALSQKVQKEVKTVHSVLGLRVVRDYASNTSQLVSRGSHAEKVLDQTLIFIDEAFYASRALNAHIKANMTINTKVVYIGDPAQLIDFKQHESCILENTEYSKARLSQVVRQSTDSPILDLVTMFRNAVETGNYGSFTPDGKSVIHHDRRAFDSKFIKDTCQPNWEPNSSKYLAWRNKSTISYNRSAMTAKTGHPHLQVEQFAVCNSFISNKTGTVKTDQVVKINSIGPATRLGVEGNTVLLSNGFEGFLPNQFETINQAKKQARKEQRYDILEVIDKNWIDLRPAYAATVDKSQGSTYKRVYIDLDDIKKCPSPNRMARLLYVATSRASEEVHLVGDIV